MVKNQVGGNKSKKGARRLMVATQTKHIREKDPNDTCEMYAYMMKLYGGSNCEVLCEDGVTRICVIRNKFRGRSKHDNLMVVGTIILVGLRDWEVRHRDKKEKCDLLCVYREDEKIRLIANADGNWRAFPETKESVKYSDDCGVVLETGDEGANRMLMKSIQDEMTNIEISSSVVEEDMEIDLDDI
jgi:translation initiation factor IF-1